MWILVQSSNRFKKWLINLYETKLINLSLANKLIGLYIIIILIPAIFFTWNYTNQNYENSIHDITNKNQYMLEIEKVNIKNNIESMRRTAQMVISDQNFIDYIKRFDETNTDQLLDYRMNALAGVLKLQSNNPNIEHIRLYTNNTYVREMWPIVFQEYRITKKEWFEEVKENNGRELWRYQINDDEVVNRIGGQKNTPKIMLLRELDYPENQHLGVIEIDMLLKNFYPKMYSDFEDENSFMFVMDSKNKLFYNHEREIAEKFPSYDQIAKQFIKHKGEKDFQFNYQGKPYLIVSTSLTELDSYMFNVIPLNHLISETKTTRNIVISGMIFLLIVLSFFSYLMIKLLFKNLYVLMHSMKKVERGDFSGTVDIKGYGEIGELANHFKNMLSKINLLIAQAVNKQAATREAELKALKTQIDAHFLYNTLENIKMMAEIEGQYEISDSLTSLGGMMRYNLKWKNDFVVLQDEINHIKNYIDIMNLRLDNKLELKLDVPFSLLDQEILKMSLQPIIENAVKHGLSETSDQSIIELHARMENQFVFIELTDNGIGMSKEQLEQLNAKLNVEPSYKHNHVQPVAKGNGIGLVNVNERIKLHYGKEYGLTIESEKDNYTKVIIKLPCLVLRGVSQHV